MACAECPACLISTLEESTHQVGHEIHVTVADLPRSRLGDFTSVCRQLGIRGYGMEILLGPEQGMLEMMSGSSVQGSDADAVRELIRVADLLDGAGLTPVRVKIESVPWHHRAPQSPGDPMPAGAYWESHVGLWLTPESTDRALGLMDSWGGYLSLNHLKPPRTSPKGVQFRASATLRSATLSRQEQVEAASALQHALRVMVGDVDTSVRTEFTWLDLAEDLARVGGPPVLAAA